MDACIHLGMDGVGVLFFFPILFGELENSIFFRRNSENFDIKQAFIDGKKITNYSMGNIKNWCMRDYKL